MQNDELLKVEHLSKWFPVKQGIVERLQGKKQQYIKAVSDVSFGIIRGENLGLVGESGCGKSTLAKCILRLLKPTDGKIVLDGTDLTALDNKALRVHRPKMQMIFQDPYSSLNPRMTVFDTIAEILKVYHLVPVAKIPGRVVELLEMCGLPAEVKDRYPGEFSGGQRQRIDIARAVTLNPDFIIADEPVSALDVSIQAQILNLLTSLQSELHQTMLFISHDLQVIRYITQRVLVMYLGTTVELGKTDEVFRHPLHPYTDILLKASPSLDPRNRKKTYVISGEPPSPVNIPSGCRFHTRCPFCRDRCKTEKPEMREILPGRYCACHFPL